LWQLGNSRKVGKNVTDNTDVFANNFCQCKYCFIDLAGTDSLAYGDIAMPLWHP
jgi:hypothetical protein